MILDKMQKKEIFTHSERAIVEYLLQNKQQLFSLTINQLADATYSSNATIIRLCQKLGFKGFREFRVAFAKELESDKYLVNTIDYSRPFQTTESTDIIINSIYSLYKKSIDQVQSQLDYEALEQMVDGFMNARRIFIFGMGDVKLTIHSFMNKMVKINYFPILATENGEEQYICPNITDKDCVMFVTYSALYKNFTSYAKILKKNSVPIFVLTANPESELLRYSTRHICVPDLEKQDKIATFYSQLVFEYLLNLIYALLYRKVK